jgi:hypothetical protein
MKTYRDRVLFITVFPCDAGPSPSPLLPVPAGTAQEDFDEVLLIDDVLSPVHNLYEALPSTVLILDTEGFVRYRRTMPRPPDWVRILEEILPDSVPTARFTPSLDQSEGTRTGTDRPGEKACQRF